MDAVYFITFVLLGAVMSGVCGFLADSKKYDFWIWVMFGLICWPVALFIIVIMPPKDVGERTKKTQEPPRFQCPECGESIASGAKHCRFCQAIISDKDRRHAKKARC